MPDVTVSTLLGLKQKGEKIAMLTAYDATFAQAACQAGVEVLLVCDDAHEMRREGARTVTVARGADVVSSSSR